MDMTLIDVAKAAGVSKSTVSRVANNLPGVTQDVRKAVLAAMEELDYHPTARRPRPKPSSRQGIRTGNVLLLVIGFSPAEFLRMPVFPSALHGIEAALRDAGLSLVLAGYRPEEPWPAALNGDQLDGVLMMGRADLSAAPLRNKLASLPGVGVFRGFEDLSDLFDRVIYHNEAIGLIQAKYLQEQGHSHVAYLNMNPDHQAFVRRINDFTAAMATAGGKVLPLFADKLPASPAQESLVMRDMVKRLLKARPAIKAIGVTTDAVLPSLYAELNDAGCKPMRDMLIVSCDNEERFISTLSPRPSTIDIRAETVGRQAVRQLIWRMGNRDEISRMTLIIEPLLLPGN